MHSGQGLEPYNARALIKLITECGGKMRAASGGNRCVFDLPNENVATCPSMKAPTVTTPMAKHVAQSLGMTYAELREQVGYPVGNGHKPKQHAMKRLQGAAFSKRDVKNRITETHALLSEVDQAIRSGLRDPDFYKRVHERLVHAQADVRMALSEATNKGAVSNGSR